MQHTFSPSLLARLHKHARPFIESIEDVIQRALDSLESSDAAPVQSKPDVVEYDPTKPPDLTWTKPLQLAVNGDVLKPEWNVLLTRMIELAGYEGLSASAIRAMLFIPSAVGQHTGSGYRFVKEAGVSFQGQNARKAWEQSAAIAKAIGSRLEAEWEWYQNPKAAKAGEKGRMVLSAAAGEFAVNQS